MKFRALIAFSLFCISSLSIAVISIPKVRGAFLYDATYAAGPSSAKTVDPGHWITNLQAFNAGATSARNQITRLYPYSGDIEIYPKTGGGYTVYVYYVPPSKGQASVAAYKAAFPSAQEVPIIDGDTNSALLKPLKGNAALGVTVAQTAANQICSDPNADGIMFDLEPFSISDPGQFSLYHTIANLFASSQCIDSAHPNGRYFGLFMNPNKIAAGDWSRLAAALGNNGYLIVSGYDLGPTKNPPVSINSNQYTAGLTGMLQTMDKESIKNKIPYDVAIPASASFSEFYKYGIYDPTKPGNFDLIKAFSQQLGFMHAARAVIFATCKSAYFMDVDYWSYNVYISPKPSANQLLLPNIIDGGVMSYLQTAPPFR